jgi:hypothetical protein
MATLFRLPYTRTKKDREVQYIVERGTATVNVLNQLPVNFHQLPGMEKPDYQSEVDALEADNAALRGHLDAIAALLPKLDQKAEALDEKNQAALRTLSGLLHQRPEAVLLAQITGPKRRKKSPPPTS